MNHLTFQILKRICPVMANFRCRIFIYSRLSGPFVRLQKSRWVALEGKNQQKTMFNFFRSIRRKFIDNDKPRRYLIYVIGEILLVMIGILLALQVNNWNEKRKARVFERKILIELKHQLEKNINVLYFGSGVYDYSVSSCKIIRKHLDEQIPYHDSLAGHFSQVLFLPSLVFNDQAYESLKTYGTHIITNDSIRAQLSIFVYPLLDDLKENDKSFQYHTAAPILTSLFYSGSMYGYGEFIPFDYDELRTSKEYRHILNTLQANRERSIEAFEEMITLQRELIELIDRELNNE